MDGIWDLIGSFSEGFSTYFCISDVSCLSCVEILKNLLVHSFNALIIPILRDCLPNYVLVFLSFDVYEFPPAILMPAVPRRLFCFGSLVILYVVCRYLSLLVLFINIEIGKIDVKC